MRRFDAVVFDLDGTLFDHDGAARDAVTEWMAQLGISPNEAAVTTWFAAEERYIRAWHRGELDWQGQRRARVRDVLGGFELTVGDDDAADAAFADYLALYEQAWRAFDDAEPALDVVAAAGLSTAVLTNGADHQQRAKLATCGLLDKAGPVFSSDIIGAAKPEPRAYLHVCEQMAVEPSRVLHVGDRYDIDVKAAREAGLSAVHLDRTRRNRADRNETIADLRQLATVLR